MLSVEAIIIGKVTYSVTDEPYTKTVMMQKATGTYRKECDKKGKCYNAPNYEEVNAHFRNAAQS